VPCSVSCAKTRDAPALTPIAVTVGPARIAGLVEMVAMEASRAFSNAEKIVTRDAKLLSLVSSCSYPPEEGNETKGATRNS